MKGADRAPDRTRSTRAAPTRLLRRCACGQHGGGGECAECRQKRLSRRLERSAIVAEAPEVAPASVHETLARGGAPLDWAARAHFERGFGRDFSRPRHQEEGHRRLRPAVTKTSFGSPLHS